MKNGFTMAEVLITIGIIGVVAAMTFPSIIARYQEKVTVTQLKKAYSILSQAFQQMIFAEGPIDNWGDTDARAKLFDDIAPKYFSILKSCGYDVPLSTDSCLKLKYKNRFNSTDAAFSNVPYARYHLIDGLTFYIVMSGYCYQNISLSKHTPDSTDKQPIYHGSYNSQCGEIYVDLNSAKGPNVFDRDLFKFYLMTDGILPAGSSKEHIWTQTFENQCLGKQLHVTGGAQCTAWVLYNENMDYLHCDDLSWTGKSRCKK